MLSYLHDQVEYLPIISMFAICERGKTRTGRGIIYASYRGVHLISLREAYVLRSAHDFHATLFFDVMDLWGKAEKNGTEDILLGRFEKGCKVPRVVNPDRGPFQDTVYYNVYGPTVFATNRPINTILESRGVMVQMPERTRSFPNDIKESDGQPFRERLVAFRARHFKNQLPDTPKPCAGRLGDILRPICQIISLVIPEESKFIGQLIEEWQRDRKADMLDSIEAEVLQAVDQLKDSVLRGKLSVKDITERINQYRTGRLLVTTQMIGKILRSLGFQKTTLCNAGAIYWDEKKLDALKERYGFGQGEEPSHDSTESPEIQSGHGG